MLELLQPEYAYALYLHTPFCRNKCAYCAFYSVASDTKLPTLQRQFINKLTEELTLVTEVLQKPFSTIYIGGGDPGLLSLDQLANVLELAHRRGMPEECTMEINPGSLSEAHEELFSLGLSRLSIGIQSMNPQHLRTLGRGATVEENLEAFRLLGEFRKRHRFRLNIDLMTCIPGQSIADARRDIDTVISAISPDHISLYNLTVEEGTPLAHSVDHGSLKVLGEDAQSHMLLACWGHLSRAGFSQYEISNFSLSRTTRSHHNEQYWTLHDYIGLGPSAAGTLSQPSGSVTRTTGAPHIHRYIQELAFSIYDQELLEKKERMIEALLVGLRTTDGIDLTDWNHRFETPFARLFPETLQMLESMKPEVVASSGSRSFSLNTQGLMVLDTIVLTFACELDRRM